MTRRGRTDRPRGAVRIAQWSARHPWRALLGWMLFVIACLAAGLQTGGATMSAQDLWVGEAGRMEAIAADAGLERPQQERILITAEDGHLDEAVARAAASELTSRIDDLPGVEHVHPPELSDSRQSLMVTVDLAGDDRQAAQNVPALLETTTEADETHPELRVEQTGDASTAIGVQEATAEDLQRAEMITIPLTGVILLVVFGALVAAAVPLVLAITAIGGAMGLYMLSTVLIPDPGGGVQNVILMMGMAVGVDYSLFYIARLREERALSDGRLPHRAAVQAAATSAGRTILVSGTAVLVALTALYIVDDVIFDAIATGSLIVVAIAMAGALTALPALLTLLGPLVDRPRMPWARAERPRRDRGRVWGRLLAPAMRHPVATLLLSVTAMSALAAPALGLRVAAEGNDTFPESVPAIAAWDRLTDEYPSEGNSHTVLVRAEPEQSDEVSKALSQLSADAQRVPGFAPTDSPQIRTSESDEVTVVDLPITDSVSSEDAEESLDHLRETLVPESVGSIEGAEYGVSGDVAFSADTIRHQAESIPWAVAAVVLLTFVMMVIAFRSVPLAVCAVALNLLSAAAAFGALVAVFQSRWAPPLLGLEPDGFISSRIPLILFVILFGLSMDYQVFVISRIREAAAQGVPSRDAIREGITVSAGVVTSAAVVMVSVFLAFVSADLMELKQTGFGLAVAILVDAVVVRVLILPSLLAILGRRAWWPSRIGRDVR